MDRDGEGVRREVCPLRVRTAGFLQQLLVCVRVYRDCRAPWFGRGAGRYTDGLGECVYGFIERGFSRVIWTRNHRY